MSPDEALSHELLNALEESVAAMDRHNVPYALIGGLAASYRSQPRFTNDNLDWIAKEWQNLAEADDTRMRRLLELVGESKRVS
jgi:hypothetical protein